jgi:hypothetical protein
MKLQCVLGLFKPIVPSPSTMRGRTTACWCAELTQREFEAERTGFFPSLQKTLNHIYVIDLFYVDALEGGWLGPTAWENPIPFPERRDLNPRPLVSQATSGVTPSVTPACTARQGLSADSRKYSSNYRMVGEAGLEPAKP